MGSSPSADLYWGYDLGDLSDHDTFDDLRPQWMQDDRDEDEVLAAALGWVETPYPAGIREHPDGHRATYEQRKAWNAQQRDTDEYRAWATNRGELRTTIADLPIELDRYGYMEEPAYCVRVKASVQRADDYGSTTIAPLIVDPVWAGQLASYMQLMQLPTPDGAEPGWHMNCSYG
jgi:hypothetical protein